MVSQGSKPIARPGAGADGLRSPAGTDGLLRRRESCWIQRLFRHQALDCRPARSSTPHPTTTGQTKVQAPHTRP